MGHIQLVLLYWALRNGSDHKFYVMCLRFYYINLFILCACVHYACVQAHTCNGMCERVR